MHSTRAVPECLEEIHNEPMELDLLDEIRISTVCRYSGSQFDLPTKQFGRPDLKLKDGSGTYTIKLKQIN